MYKDPRGNCWYKVGLHTHTTRSDGLATPQQMARIYRDAGYDAVALTDHWCYSEACELEGLQIISGCEYNLGGGDSAAGVMHIVGVGMNADPCLQDRSTPPQQVIDAIREKGGLAILAHPHWSLNTPGQVRSLRGFSAVEIYNTVSNVVMSNRPDSGYFIDCLANEGYILPVVCADDVHYYRGEDECRSYVMVQADSGESGDILRALAEGRHYSTQGPELCLSREGGRIIVDCSPVCSVAFMSANVWSPDRMRRGEGITHAEYEPRPFERWLRVEVRDAQDRCAWSNIIRI